MVGPLHHTPHNMHQPHTPHHTSHHTPGKTHRMAHTVHHTPHNTHAPTGMHHTHTQRYTPQQITHNTHLTYTVRRHHTTPRTTRRTNTHYIVALTRQLHPRRSTQHTIHHMPYVGHCTGVGRFVFLVPLAPPRRPTLRLGVYTLHATHHTPDTLPQITHNTIPHTAHTFGLAAHHASRDGFAHHTQYHTPHHTQHHTTPHTQHHAHNTTRSTTHTLHTTLRRVISLEALCQGPWLCTMRHSLRSPLGSSKCLTADTTLSRRGALPQ